MEGAGDTGEWYCSPVYVGKGVRGSIDGERVAMSGV